MLPKRINYQTDEMVSQLTDLVTAAYFIAGINKYTDKDLSMNVAYLAKELTSKYSYLQPAEVRFAIEEGCKGTYGEYQGINIRSICGWIRGYLKSDERTRYLKSVEDAYNRSQPSRQIATTSATPETVEEFAKRVVNEEYCRMRNGGEIQAWYWPFLGRYLTMAGITVEDPRQYFKQCITNHMEVIFR